MIRALRLLFGALIGLFRSSARREAGILVLRHQINVLGRKSPKKPALTNVDRLLFVWLSRLVPTMLAALTAVTPETVIRWHRAGFRVSLSKTQSGWQVKSNRAMLLLYERGIRSCSSRSILGLPGRPWDFQSVLPKQPERRILALGRPVIGGISLHSSSIGKPLIPGIRSSSNDNLQGTGNMLSRILSLMFASCVLAFSTAGSAQNYPVRPIRWVVPAPPGRNNDIFARIVAQHLSKALRQPVVIDNRAGAGSIIGTDNVAKSPPDGYTILMTPSSIVINVTLYKELPYNTLNDFTGIAMLAAQPLVVVVNPSSGIATLKDLIARAKAKPGALNYGSGGIGTPQHLATEMFRGLAGVNIIHIPYKGSTGAITDLLANQVEFMIEPSATVIPHITSGALRALAVTTPTRSPLIPDVPTAEEAGLPGFVLKTWYGVLAPAGTPREIVERLGAEISAIVRMPEVEQAFAKQGATPVLSSPREFDEFIRSEIKTWGKLVKDANVTIN